MPAVEFDLAGERVALADEEVEWLLAAAVGAAGSSAAAAELATMLASRRGSTRRRYGPIVLQRGDQRVIRELLAAGGAPGRELERLWRLLNTGT